MTAPGGAFWPSLGNRRYHPPWEVGPHLVSECPHPASDARTCQWCPHFPMRDMLPDHFPGEGRSLPKQGQLHQKGSYLKLSEKGQNVLSGAVILYMISASIEIWCPLELEYNILPTVIRHKSSCFSNVSPWTAADGVWQSSTTQNNVPQHSENITNAMATEALDRFWKKYTILF